MFISPGISQDTSPDIMSREGGKEGVREGRKEGKEGRK